MAGAQAGSTPLARVPERTAIAVAQPVAPGALALGALADVARLTDPDACSACGLCATVCPQSAIELSPLPAIDEALCTACGECVDACPGGALSLVTV